MEGAPADVRPHAGSKMLRRLATTWCPIAACALALLPVAPADDDPGLVIGIAHFPPLVMEAERGFEGFDIDIWNEVSGAMGIESTFRLMPFSELLGAVERGEVDAALAGISVTLDREVALDFSHPYMRSGLRILTTVDQDPVWMRVVRSFTTEAGAGIVGYLAAFVLLCAHILYFAEHGDSGIDDRYFPGIFEAVWCVLATITTVGYGDVTPRRWLGRFVSLAVMMIGISLFGIAVAQLSAGLMAERLKSDIGGPNDLSGRVVATVAGTTSTEVAVRYGSRLREVENIEIAYGLLQSGNVDAILFDAAPLMRYALVDGYRTVTVVGPLVEPQAYGIAFPAGSELREPVNRELLRLEQTGEYDRIHRRWFGATDQ